MRVGFAGTGVAALLTARALVDRLGDRVELVLVDRGFSEEDVRTYAYWSRGEDPLTPLLRQVHRRFEVVAADGERVGCTLDRWRYGMLRGEDLRRALLEPLRADPRVRCVEAEVEAVEARADGAVLVLEQERIAVDLAFDSRFELEALEVPSGRVGLVQSFSGVRLRTEAPCFDHDPVLMDFRVSQADGVQFVYVLPDDPHHALVEAVHIAPAPRRADLDGYLSEVLGLQDWKVEAREGGATPMTDAPFVVGSGPVQRLGIAGGRLRPSTGYGLPRMLADAEQIAASLDRGALARWQPPRWSAFLDGVFLHLLAADPRAAPGVFLALFRANPADRVVALLQERAGLQELVPLVWSLPWGPFLRALWRWGLARSIGP